MRIVKELILFVLSFSLVLGTAYAANAEEVVSFASSPLWLNTAHVTEGKLVQISTVVMKRGSENVFGTVRFIAGGKEVGTADFSLSDSVPGAVVAVSFVPPPGKHSISAIISEARVIKTGNEETVKVSDEIKASETLVVDADMDRDGIPDATDLDDDNDTISDLDEKKNGTNPLAKEVSKTVATPAVAGMATTSLNDAVEKASALAHVTGNTVFATTELFRTKGAAFFDEKLRAAETTREAARAAAADIQTADERAVEGFRPLSEQLKDTSGILGGIKVQVYSIGATLFKNAYAFYIVFIVFVLWVLRKIWRRHSLD
jgi:hypothetical protein